MNVIPKPAGTDPELGQDFAHRSADLLGHGMEELSEPDLVDVVALGLSLGAVEQVEQARAHVGHVVGLRQALESALAELHHHFGIGSGALEHRRDPWAPLDAAGQQVNRSHLSVFVLVRELLSPFSSRSTPSRSLAMARRPYFRCRLAAPKKWGSERLHRPLRSDDAAPISRW